MNIAVFASGGGSNFQALLDRKSAGDLPAVTFTLVVGNNSKSQVFERARRGAVETFHIAPSHFDSDVEYTQKLLSRLEEKSIDLIVLAGYMKKIPVELTQQYKNRIINIHPALLPAFGGKGMYGMNVHKAVLEFGTKITGITVHSIDEEYDRGYILYQSAVEVKADDDADTLANRVLRTEHDSYWRVVKALSEGRVKITNDGVIGSV